MRKIGAYEAKTHLPRLLEKVQNGESFLITKRGQAVAELVPVAAKDRDRINNAVDDLKALKNQLHLRGVTLGGILEEGETVRDLAHRGHRF